MLGCGFSGGVVSPPTSRTARAVLSVMFKTMAADSMLCVPAHPAVRGLGGVCVQAPRAATAGKGSGELGSREVGRAGGRTGPTQGSPGSWLEAGGCSITAGHILSLPQADMSKPENCQPMEGFHSGSAPALP